MTTAEDATSAEDLERPSILDEVMEWIEEPVRKENLAKAKRLLEDQIMEVMSNIRMQESLVEQKAESYAMAEGLSDREDKLLREALENARIILKDRYQGAVSLAEELKSTNLAIEEMKSAGLGAFERNRAGRRAKRK